MNQTANHIKIDSTFQVQPITIVDTLKQEKSCCRPWSFFSNLFPNLFSAFFEKSDLSFQEWQRLESKPRRKSSSEHAQYLYGRGL